MAIEEPAVGVTDICEAQMVECVPQPEPDAPLPVTPDETPTAQSQDATIEQTGAGPPPKAVRLG